MLAIISNEDLTVNQIRSRPMWPNPSSGESLTYAPAYNGTLQGEQPSLRGALSNIPTLLVPIQNLHWDSVASEQCSVAYPKLACSPCTNSSLSPEKMRERFYQQRP